MIVLCMFSLLLVRGGLSVEVDYFEYGAGMVQTQKPTGQYLFDNSGRELLHVDLDSKQVVWTLPGYEEAGSFDVQGGLQNINTAKFNLDIMMKRSNYTPATSVKPRVRVYTEHPVVLGEPNILICSVTNIFPPVMNITWLKNGEKVALGVTETIFLPCQDHAFLKFLYLAFIPTVNDIYTCEVEHWGLDGPKRVFWGQLDVRTPRSAPPPPSPRHLTSTMTSLKVVSYNVRGLRSPSKRKPEVPPVQSETTQTIICALGLSVGIIGIIAGVVLLMKGVKHNTEQRMRGNY